MQPHGGEASLFTHAWIWNYVLALASLCMGQVSRLRSSK